MSDPVAGAPAREASTGQYEDQLLLVLTLVIGAVVGLVVVAFILLTENLGSRLYPAGGAAWRRLAIPVAGALGTGFFLARYFPNARGSGIPQTKTALFLHDGFISFRTAIGKFVMCSITLASGIALGREGPSVQVSAGIASVLGRRLGLSPRGVRALVPIGASAALAAAFNTPIAAVLFTLEEVMGDLHAPVLGSIVLSSATSWMVLHLLLGDEPLFHAPSYQLVNPLELLFYAVLGVAGGLVSVAFVKLLLWQRKYFLRMPKSTQWVQPVAGGLLVGILGWFVPGVLGVGYSTVGDALNGKLMLGAMALLVCLKLVATATCYSSGNAGGIFGPSLFIGAMLGGAFGGVAHTLLPDYTGSVGAYALVGMGAAFAGIIRVPLTSVIMIFEVTRDYAIIVPLMIANLISYYISSRLQEEPIYEALLHQDGIHLPSGARARHELVTVGHAFRPEAQVLDAGETVARAATFVDRSLGAWPVSDGGGLRGMLTAEQLDRAVKEGHDGQTLGDLVPAPGSIETLTHESFAHVHPDHALDVAIRRMALSHLPVLPVVSRTNLREIKGTISMREVLDTYAIGKLPASPTAAPRSTSPIRGLVAILVVLSVVVALVNYSYRTSRANRASHDYQTANRLMEQQRFEEAIGYYRDALSVAPNIEYRLALGFALVEAGHLDEAAIYLNEAIGERPRSGRANLGLARIAAQRGNIDAAVSYYQRAAYGTWPADMAQNRFKALLEEVEFLAKTGRRAEAQAQLLAAAATTPGDPALRQHVARLFASLADAQFTAGDYAGARGAYRNSLRFDSSDQAAAARLEACDRIMSLDPTLPGLNAATRQQRSRELLAAVAAALADCSAARRPKPRATTTEANLALAAELWSERQSSCGQPAAPDDPLALVMAKLAHRP